MREFRKMIFLGAGEHSTEDVKLLKDRLKSAIEILGGLQQPDHSESLEEAQENKEWREEAEQELNEIVSDIVTALTGEEPFDCQDGRHQQWKIAKEDDLCYNCASWQLTYPGEYNMLGIGECRRYPKVIHKEYNDWCREFERDSGEQWEK